VVTRSNRGSTRYVTEVIASNSVDVLRYFERRVHADDAADLVAYADGTIVGTTIAVPVWHRTDGTPECGGPHTGTVTLDTHLS